MAAKIMRLLLCALLLCWASAFAQLEPVDLHHHKFWDKPNAAIHSVPGRITERL